MSGWIWPYFAVITLGLARLLVPPARWRELFVSAFLGGFVLTFPVQYLFEVILGAWVHYYPFWNVMGLPVWLAIVWFGEVLIFLNYLPQQSISRLVYVTVFALTIGALVGIMVALGIRPLLRGWSPLQAAMLAFILHCAVIGIDFMVRGVAGRESVK